MSFTENRHLHNKMQKRKHGLTCLLLVGTLLLSCGNLSLSANAEPSQNKPQQSAEDISAGRPDAKTDTSSDTDTETAPDTATDTDTDPDNSDILTDDTKNSDLYTSSSDRLDLFSNGNVISSFLYNNTNGLQTSEANAIAQTSDGFIWVGSQGGLFRYDGSSFEKYELNGIASVRALYTDSKEELWIGAANNGIAVMEQGRIKKYWGENEGFVSGTVNAIAEDDGGIIYFATSSGIAFVNDNLELSAITDERLSRKYIYDLKKGPDGLVYGLDKEGHAFTLREGRITQYADSGCAEPVCLMPDPRNPGSLYLSSLDLQYYAAFNGNAAKLSMIDTFYNGLFNTQNMEYVGSLIWYCATSGISAFRPGEHRVNYRFDKVEMTSLVGHVMQDYQGNYWFTSTHEGVMKITPTAFDDIYYRKDFSEDVVNSTCIYNDILVAATDTSLRFIEDGNTDIPFLDVLFENDFYYEFDTSIRILFAAGDSSDRLWIATWGNGLYCIDGKDLHKYKENSGGTALSSNYIRYVRESKNGDMLIISEGGLDVMRDKKVIRSYGKKDGIDNTSILCLEEGLNGEIFLGSDGGGIYIIEKDGSVSKLDRSDGLSSGVIERIKKDRTRNIFWIITGDSIAYMTEDRKITTVTKFPHPTNYDIIQNSRDEMWILSNSGIFVVPTEKMLNNDDIVPVHYGIENGLTRSITSNSYSTLSDDGFLYICCNTGVLAVNVETAFLDKTEIRTVIPYLYADDEKVYPDSNGNFNIPSSVRKLTICSYVPDYSLTTPLVSYTLEGFDSEYTTVSRKSLMPVDYTNLPGGDYRYVIKVTGSDGTDYCTASVTITKQKAFYEEAWFYIIVSLLVILILAAAVQLIWVARMKKLRAKHREEVERERISTELETAGDIQNDMLPDAFPAFPDRTDFDVYAKMDPAKEVGGDFYDFFLTDDDHLCVIIADVCGKGIPAALFMMRSKIILQEYAKVSGSPAEILRRANDSVCANNKSEMFVSVWIGILEISSGRLIAANAGHEFPALTNAEGKFELHKDKHGMVVGGMPGYKYNEYELSLSPGSKLFLYTDGVPEATDASEQLFGFDRMMDALNEDPDATPEQILTSVRRHVDAFVKDAEQFDDLTMLCLEYKGPHSAQTR